jgi:hypothetical protein
MEVAEVYRLELRGSAHMAKTLLLLGLASAALTLGGAALAADIPEACNSYKAAVTGGPLPPPESDTVVIRWLANANFEFGYRGKVYLFDAYFDRTPRSRMLGFKAADVSKAEAIFISHAHFDRRSQPIDATLYLRGKRWSVGWNGDFIEVLPRQKRRNYGTVGSAGSH